jgi:hypothetical protein
VLLARLGEQRSAAIIATVKLGRATADSAQKPRGLGFVGRSYLGVMGLGALLSKESIMQPVAKTDGVTVRRLDDGFLLQGDDSGESFFLHPITYEVWKRSDGSASVAQIASAIRAELHTDIQEEAVWSALDQLADANLLQHRLTPPGATSSLFGKPLLRKLGTSTGASLLAEKSAPTGIIGSRPQMSEQDDRRREEQKWEEQRQKERDKDFREREDKKTRKFEKDKEERRREVENKKAGS